MAISILYGYANGVLVLLFASSLTIFERVENWDWDRLGLGLGSFTKSLWLIYNENLQKTSSLFLCGL